MALDFLQVRQQVTRLGENAPLREQHLKVLREQANALLKANASNLEELCQKINLIVKNYDPSFRCALPVDEPLDAHFPLPRMPKLITILAADGSQITPNRHSEIEYGLINVGAVQMQHGSGEPPVLSVISHLLYDTGLETAAGTISEATLALRRDLNERAMLAEIASQAILPVVTFTDGPMELWGAKEPEGEAASEFQKSLVEYLEILDQLHELKVITAGYVDKPSANLVIRLLEAALTPQTELAEIRKHHPLRGVTDINLYSRLLDVGERSPVFAIQSQSARQYTGKLALHFFYLNVGRPTHPWLARVEIPAWVAQNPIMLNDLQAVLVNQCQVMGARPYPYLLHRAHETALVSLDEQEQVTQMIVLELRRRGVTVGEKSYKQSNKDLPGRTRR